MRARLTGAAAAVALAVLAALATPSMAQELPTPTASPTPSPTASPTPSAEPTPTPQERKRAERDERDRKSKPVRRIYRDFERDGRIDDCDHSVDALKKARRSIEESYGEEYPDFRDAVTAAIDRHRAGRCEEQEQQLEDRNRDATPTPSATATPAPGGSTPAPAPAPAPAPPASAPDSGSLPDFGAGGSGGSGGSGGAGGLTPAPAQPGEDAIPEGTPSPTPAPQATPAPPPKLVVTRAAADPNLFVPGTLLAVALIGLHDRRALGARREAHRPPRRRRPRVARGRLESLGNLERLHRLAALESLTRTVRGAPRPPGVPSDPRRSMPSPHHSLSSRRRGGIIGGSTHGADAADDHLNRTAQER